MVQVRLTDAPIRGVRHATRRALLKHARVLVDKVVIFSLVHRCTEKGALFFLVLGHELVLDLVERMKRIVVHIVGQAATAQFVPVSDLDLQPAGSFAEELVMRRDVIACRREVLFARVENAVDVVGALADLLVLEEHLR